MGDIFQDNAFHFGFNKRDVTCPGLCLSLNDPSLTQCDLRGAVDPRLQPPQILPKVLGTRFLANFISGIAFWAPLLH